MLFRAACKVVFENGCVVRAETWRSKLVVHSDELKTIHTSFFAAVEELPETMEGLSSLVTDAFWQLVDLGTNGSKKVRKPALWANDEIGTMLLQFSFHREDELDLDTEDWMAIQRLREDLMGQAAMEVMRMEPEGPLLELLARPGMVLHNPTVHFLIGRGFKPLASEVSQAVRALQASCTDSQETVLKGFQELACLTKGEIRIIMRATETGERGKGAANLLAAELVGGRCGLEVSTVLKYAQPGRPKSNRKKQK